MIRFLVATAILTSISLAHVRAQPLAKQTEQGTYAVPFASESNRIEVEVVNSTDDPLKDVSVQVDAVPLWLTFETSSETIGVLKPGETTTAIFTFDLDEKAPVGEVAELRFDIVSETRNDVSSRPNDVSSRPNDVSSRPNDVSSRPEGGIPHPDESGIRDDNLLETRAIRIQPEAPTELTLRGNYPNPFNPTTRIAYALPKDGNVEIEVFNAIGRRVTRLVDQVQQAGYQEATWNALGTPSGVYFYAIRLDADRARQVKVGRMVVVK